VGVYSTLPLFIGIKIICELERIYCIKNGGDRKTNGRTEKNQSDIADELNIDVKSYQRYKKLTTLIPELQEMVDDGNLTTSVASRIICELERIYGIKKGNNQYSEDGRNATTQKDIANELNISTKDLQRYKKLTTLIPELQEMVDDGNLTTSVASRIICELERIYEIKQGNNQHTTNGGIQKSQSDIAKE
jgi:RPA family protein